ncbi:hypothetical protein AMTR_s00022p00224990 [Amborella trichopoda]|uniref:F-box domain-containing protein n=1 Tax=Amborella trichopoda TaxID=13333 RepID=W1PNW6_AMBTC|nr:hypothetical protein AMTR_s00022p00224990 [Amborella trichopoda]
MQERLGTVCSLFDALPDELVEKILLFLPVKSVLTLKRVSQSWNRFVSSRSFAESYYISSSEQPSQPQALVLSRMVERGMTIQEGNSIVWYDYSRRVDKNYDYLMAVYANHRRCRIEIRPSKLRARRELSERAKTEPVLTIDTKKYEFVSEKLVESHGILCCLTASSSVHGPRHSLSIVNPCTGQYTALHPLPPYREGNVQDIGFYFDPQSCTFMICAHKVKGHIYENLHAYMLFDSTTGEWRRPRSSAPLCGSRLLRRGSVTLGHTYYSLRLACRILLENHTSLVEDGHLLAFDMEREESQSH